MSGALTPLTPPCARTMKTAGHCAAADERGAIALIAAFMGIFLAGTLFYVIGIADAAIQRSSMQDAADATSFAAAVVHAKGMNAIVLCNLVMAAALAVLVALRLITTVALAAVVLATALSFLNPVAAGAIGPASATAQWAEKTFNNVKPYVERILEAVNGVATGISRVMPAAGVVRATEATSAHRGPRVTFGTVIPESLTLPVEDGDPALLCRKAGRMAGTVATLGLGVINDVAPLRAPAVALIEELAAAAPGWFCGTEGGEARRHTQEQEVALPRLAVDEACLDTNDEVACRRMADELDRARPDRESGKCMRDCNVGDPYFERAVAARTQCRPGRGKRLVKFHFQVQRVTRTYLRARGGWQPSEEPATVHWERLQESSSAPCETAAGAPRHRRWQAQAGDPTDPAPLCQVKAPTTTVARGPKGRPDETRRRVTSVEVTHILACVEAKEVDVTPDGYGSGSESKSSGPSQKPKALVQDVVHGGAPLQLRSIVLGAAVDKLPERVMKAASRGRISEAWGHARELGRAAVAQSEYHFDGELDEDAMWHTAWTARITRFQLPESDSESSADVDPASTLQTSCGGLHVCDAFNTESLGAWVTH